MHLLNIRIVMKESLSYRMEPAVRTVVGPEGNMQITTQTVFVSENEISLLNNSLK